MNRICLIVLFISLVFFLLGSVSRLQAAQREEVFEARLANGLQVLLLPDRKAAVVTIQVWYKVGSRNEPYGQSGLAHLTEHLMFRGTEKVGPKQYSRTIQKYGGQDNAFTSRDHTVYFENLASDHLMVALELEADRMTALKVDEEKFSTEKKVVQEERRLRVKDDPSATLFEEVVSTAFKSHPYRWPVTGWMEDLERLRREDFLAFYRTYYQPANAVLVVVGDIEKETVLPLIKKTFGRVPQGPPLPVSEFKESPQEADKRITLHRREAQLPYVLLAYHVPSFPHPDAFALEVMSQILAGGKSSRLVQKMVYQEQKALDVGADYPFLSRDPFLFFFYAQAMPGQSPEQIEARLYQELEEWKKSPPTQEEIKKAKNQIEAGFIFSQDSIFNRGKILGKYQSLGTWKGLEEYLSGIRKVSREDLLRVYQTYIEGKKKTIGILIPGGSVQEKGLSGEKSSK
jgi:zinc protease